MKAVILAGGFGTRISEESGIRPKPMVELGGRPILWHILKTYSHYGINDFVICCGYKAHVIKDYFVHYSYNNSDISVNLKDHNVKVLSNHTEPWNITLAETGLDSMTGGRLRRVRKYVEGETFLCTYGDGVSNVDIAKTIEFHNSHKKIATVIAVQPPGRFGVFNLEDGKDSIGAFREKPSQGGSWINGGYMVLGPEVFDYIENDLTVFEKEPMMKLAHEGQLMAYRHEGYWQCMDTLRDKHVLEEIWQSGKAPWKVWK